MNIDTKLTKIAYEQIREIEQLPNSVFKDKALAQAYGLLNTLNKQGIILDRLLAQTNQELKCPSCHSTAQEVGFYPDGSNHEWLICNGCNHSWKKQEN